MCSVGIIGVDMGFDVVFFKEICVLWQDYNVFVCIGDLIDCCVFDVQQIDVYMYECFIDDVQVVFWQQ